MQIVSIHAPARGATMTFECYLSYGFCFNPRARAGRDQGALCFLVMQEVSIHAPARGATIIDGIGDHCLDVSIHAPARGATTFDTTAPPAHDVSIHAPARGATNQIFQANYASPFQSTRPRGARP